MQWFRSVADGRSDDQAVAYATISGTAHGPKLSALALGGAYLQAWGANDGMVPEKSAHKPGATHTATLKLDHDAMRTARTWPAVTTALAETAPVSALEASAAPALTTGAVLRGGSAEGGAHVALPIEGGARSAQVFVLTSKPARVALRAPDGRQLRATAAAPLAEVFAQAQTYAVQVTAPAAGEWSVEIQAPGSFGYLVAAMVDSPAVAALQLPSGPLAPGSAVPLSVQLSPALSGVRVTASAALAAANSSPALSGDAAPANAADGAAVTFDAAAGGTLALPQQPGVYPLALTVSGTLPDGSQFERSYATSIAVAPPRTPAAAPS